MKKLQIVLVCGFALFSGVQCASKNQAVKRDKRVVSKPQPTHAVSYYHFLLGELSRHEEDSEAALRHYQFASQFDSSDTLKLKQAEQLVSLGKVVESKELLADLDNSSDPEYHLLRARISALELDFGQSKVSLDKAIKIFRKQKDSRKVREITLMKVALLSDSRQYEEAITDLRSYLKERPNDEIGYYFLGKIYSITQQKEKAIQAFKRALSLKPNFSTVSRALGLQYEMAGQSKEAIEVYHQALVYGGDDFHFRQKLANLYLMEENYTAALEHFRQLSIIASDNVQVLFRTALLHFKMKNYDEAEALFVKLLSDGDLAQDRLNFYLGALNEQRGELESSVDYFSKITESSEYFVDAQLQIVNVYSNSMSKPEKSIDSLRRAILKKPDSQELYLSLANQHESINELAEAIRVLHRANRNLPTNERILFVLGTFLDRAGDKDAGILRMRQILKLNPNHAHALNHIGYVYTIHEENLDEAEELLLRAVQLEPKNGFIIDSLGWLYYKKGKFDKARELLERAEKYEPNEPEILEHLADTYKKMNLHDKALGYYRKVMEINQSASSDAVQENSKESQERDRRVRRKIASLEGDEQL